MLAQFNSRPSPVALTERTPFLRYSHDSTLIMGMPAAGASLLLNAEGVFTALLAWLAFKENFDRRIALGMIAIMKTSRE